MEIPVTIAINERKSARDQSISIELSRHMYEILKEGRKIEVEYRGGKWIAELK